MNREELIQKIVEESIKARGKVLEARKTKFQRFDIPPLPTEANYAGGVSSGGGIAPIEPEPGNIWKDTYSMYFDGELVDKSVTVAADPSFDIITNLTISAWVKPDATGAPAGKEPTVIDKATSTWEKGYSLYQDNAAPGLWRFTIGNGTKFTAQAPVPNTDWQHLVGTYDPDTGDQILYLNGLQVDTVNTGGGSFTNAGSSDFTIGAGHDTGTDEFVGFIDEVAVWNATLTPGEILDIWNSGCPNDLLTHSPTVGRVGCWRMGEDATFLAGNWTFPNLFNPGVGDGVSFQMIETDRRTEVPC